MFRARSYLQQLGLDHSHWMMDGLIAWYPGWEGGGSKIFDISGNRGIGTLNGDTAWTAGRNGSALQFDGTTDYIECTGLNKWIYALGPLVMSASVWVNFDASLASQWDSWSILKGETDPSGANDPLSLSFRSFSGTHTISATVRITTGGGSSRSVSYNHDLRGTGWRHIGVTASPTDLRLYLDGVLVATTSAAASFFKDNLDKLFWGHTSTFSPEAKIENVSIWNQTLSSSRMQELAVDPWVAFRRREISLSIESETIRPDGDITDGGWLTDLGGADLWTAIDETTASDADYIESGNNPSLDVCEVTLSNPATITTFRGSGHTVSYRYLKSGSGGRDIEIRVRLLQGATEIASWTHSTISDVVAQADQVLTTAQTSNITDYDDLRLEFRANVSGSGAGRRGQVTWAEMVVVGESAVATTGTAAQTVGAATQSASGTMTPGPITGTAAQSTAATTQSASGVVHVIGTAAQSTAATSQAASGTMTSPVVTGSAAQSTGAATQAASGVLHVIGTAAQSAGAATQSASGTASAPGVTTGTAEQTVGAASQAASGTATVPTFTGTAAQSTAAATQIGSGSMWTNLAAAISQAAPAATQSATGTYTAATGATVPGIEYSLPDGKLHYTLENGKLHYTLRE